MDQKRLEELYDIKDNILMDINDELAKYNLFDYDFEYGVYYQIDFAEYPQQLQNYLKFAWAELDKIEEEIKNLCTNQNIK